MTDELEQFEDLEPLTDDEILECQPLNTDAYNADLFVKRYAETFKFVTQWDAWLAWDATRWVLDGAEDRALDKAIYSARASYVEHIGRVKFLEDAFNATVAKRGGKSDDSDKLKDRIAHELKIAGWYLTSQSSGKLHACVGLARPKLHVAMSHLDADPWMFNVANGTIDLRTGELHAHDRTQMITQISPIEWNDRAKCPTWDRFMLETMQGDAELVMYLQRVVGYCMTGLIDEHALFFLYGDGGNGKSTFTRTIHSMMGEYAAPAPRGLLFEQKTGSAHPTELAMLYGRRFVSCAEIGEQSAFDEAKVKDLTGGDPIAVRRMNEDFWPLAPVHKLMIAGQYKPKVAGDDKGIWRRIRLIPWVFTTNSPDLELARKLSKELPGILRWAVNGASEWHRIGLSEPQAVRDATQDYRDESNIIGEFLKVCDRDPDYRCTGAELRRYYERWCSDMGHTPVGARMFSQRLQRNGIKPCSVRVGMNVVRGWAGLSTPGSVVDA